MCELQSSEPLDPGTVNSSTFVVSDSTTGQNVAGNYSLSSDGRTVSLLPSAALAISRTYYVYFSGRGITDLAGNQLHCGAACDFSFTTGTTTSTAVPQVIGVSPGNGKSGIAINAQVVIQFNEPVDGATVSQVTLSSGSGTANVAKNLSNGNQTLTLIPAVPLATSTSYTLNIAGVQDLSGNGLAAPVTVSFTTGTGADLTGPKVVSISPASNAVGVPTNAVVQVQFSKAVDALTVTATTLEVFPQATGTPVAGTIAVSADGQTATFTPSAPLNGSTSYAIQATNGITDVEGQGLSYFYSYFTTSSGTATGPTIVSLSPPSATIGSSLAIQGVSFGASQGSSSVTFSGAIASVTSWSDSQIVMTVPSGAKTGAVTVTVNGNR